MTFITGGMQQPTTIFFSTNQESISQSHGGMPSARKHGRRERNSTRSGEIAEETKISWKRAREIAIRTFKQSKRLDMQQYLESMKVNTPPAKIYEKRRKMRSRPPRRINVKQEWHTRE